jgi:hypothetical protein
LLTRRRSRLAAAVAAAVASATAAAVLGVMPARAFSVTRIERPLEPAARETEPVVLTGANFPGWAAPADVSAKVPTLGGLQCLANDQSPQCTHSSYEKPEVSTGAALGAGVAVTKLLGYRWDGRHFVQIPFQVDELAVRYLSNNASGFAAYSETDAHPTYVFDEERFRWLSSAAADPCTAIPTGGVRTTPDPVPGLDTNDEVSFMANDAGPAAPPSAALPAGITSMKRVTIVDPYDARHPRYAYVMLAGDGPGAPTPAFNAGNGYVRYQPDADSDTFVYSQSSYGDYGNAPKGPYVDDTTHRCTTGIGQYKQRRPKDTAWIRTPRFAFRYDGRWLMTELRIAPAGKTWTYGPDIIDQWKARAFQQRPGGTTPCCGYEDEQVNWGGSSILMGVRSGPVRVIRATWGADSGTNTVRAEVFYRDEIRQVSNLRVHPVPPADGIYTQWDYNAGKVSTYYNPYVPFGVKIDGRNDEVFGNLRPHIGLDGIRLEGVRVGQPGDGSCTVQDNLRKACIDNDIDVVDPLHSGPHGALSYEEVTGPYGTLVSRYTVKQYTPGALQLLLSLPYYRDDSCFDDGTGNNPGLHVRPRKTDLSVDSHGNERTCWRESDGDPAGYAPDRFFQGDIGTHGVHLELIADADNAFTTVPLTEVDVEQRIVLLSGLRGNVGEKYGRGLEKPLVIAVL